MSAAANLSSAPSLVDLLLAEQRALRAVDEFSDWHARSEVGVARFETLIPAAAPGPGQQYAFSVDLDACTGCKACVTACHSLNGLEDGETWRRVGELEGDGWAATGAPGRQSVTTACHHCEDPACLAGCPVQAYEKDPTTGVVVHLDDQCIGCRYCQLTCPYDVPQFSERLGIVRKCDLCHGRLAAGEAPACVQGCPNGAIAIALVEVGSSAPAVGATLLPMVAGGMALSSLTRPTTRYRSTRAEVAPARSVEPPEPTPAEPHEPLAVMLVLTQGAVGVLFFDCVAANLLRASGSAGPVFGSARAIALALAGLLGFAGLAASFLHLGRPQWAFRAFLGLRTSWMSREIVVFGGFAGALGLALVASLARALGAPSALAAPLGLQIPFEVLIAVSRGIALAAGVAGVYCSARIYAVTGRPLWRMDRTARRFAGTTLLLGAGALALAWALATSVATLGAQAEFAEAYAGLGSGCAVTLGLLSLAAGAGVAKHWGERGCLVHGDPGHDDETLARTRRLLAGALAGLARRRARLGRRFVTMMVVATMSVAALAALAGTAAARSAAHFDGMALAVAALGVAVLACGLAFGIAGELAERSLFFRAEAMRGMPGGRGR